MRLVVSSSSENGRFDKLQRRIGHEHRRVDERDTERVEFMEGTDKVVGRFPTDGTDATVVIDVYWDGARRPDGAEHVNAVAAEAESFRHLSVSAVDQPGAVASISVVGSPKIDSTSRS